MNSQATAMFKVVIIAILTLLLKVSNAIQSCSSFNLQDWDCLTYQYHFSESNLEHTLFCLGYNKLTYPSTPNVTKVFVKRELLQLVEINEDNGMISLEDKYEVRLFDQRLSFDFCSQLHGDDRLKFNGKSLKMFWSPDFDTSYDTWFKPKADVAQIYMNKKMAQDTYNFRMKNVKTRIVIRCEMKYQWFPFDIQKCPHAFIIDADPKDVQIIFDPIEVLHHSYIQKHFNPDWYISLEIRNVFKNEKQILPLDLIFQRKIFVHILHLFVPSTMLCIASMASLFIPQDYVPGRMGLSVTSCLSMITLFIAAKNSWPRTADIKAIDYWVLLCYFTAFFCLLEYCVVLAVNRGSRTFANLIERASKVFIPVFLPFYIIVYFSICYTFRK